MAEVDKSQEIKDLLLKQMEKVKTVVKELMEEINDFIPSDIKE